MRITIDLDSPTSQPRLSTSGASTSGVATSVAAQDAGASRGVQTTARLSASALRGMDAGAAPEHVSKKKQGKQE